ncbi:hypothetical protein B0T21DRAFT_372940 [Apiosordaria backusii]|uniref:Uncharacterized protein n=1 Tax=Apiosordaria backusii TaxID=314023 RepID=A0AA40AXW7_9PEZI|nr:hypothetical protein B0T21DRAFT_372940 [Apiosordaria backusii]
MLISHILASSLMTYRQHIFTHYHPLDAKPDNLPLAHRLNQTSLPISSISGSLVPAGAGKITGTLTYRGAIRHHTFHFGLEPSTSSVS